MPGKYQNPLQETFLKSLRFLQKAKTPYLIIGGLAAGILGEPRATMDVDFDIILDKKNKQQLKKLLETARKLGFQFAEKALWKDIQEHGVFKLFLKEQHVDFIVASTDLEKEAFARKLKIKIYGAEAYFPTPEDLILLKLVPARKQDILDIERIIHRHGKKLDRKYLEHWAQRLSDEAKDLRIYHTLQQLLRSNMQ